MPLERFDKQSPRPLNPTAVTIYAGGRLQYPSLVDRALNSPSHVLFSYDPVRRLIAIEATSVRSLARYTVQRQYKASARVDARAVLAFLGVEPNATERYYAAFNANRLIIDTQQPTCSRFPLDMERLRDGVFQPFDQRTIGHRNDLTVTFGPPRQMRGSEGAYIALGYPRYVANSTRTRLRAASRSKQYRNALRLATTRTMREITPDSISAVRASSRSAAWRFQYLAAFRLL